MQQIAIKSGTLGIIVAICSLLLPTHLQAHDVAADTTRHHHFLETLGGYGFVMPHHTSIAYHVEDHIQPVHLRWGIKTRGTKAWQHAMGLPEMGIGLFRSNLGNNEIYGTATALYGFAAWSLFPPLNLRYQIGFGLAHLTKHFDAQSNYTNIAIGSHLNIYFDATLKTHIPLNRQWRLLYFLQFTHFSNGKLQSPNKGLNLITNNIGVSYHFGNLSPHKGSVFPAPQPPAHHVSVWTGIGLKTISRDVPGRKLASTLGIHYRRSPSSITSWGGGLDLFYDESLRKDPKPNAPDRNSNLYQLGLHADLDKHIERFTITVQIGGYLYTPVTPEGPVYTRLGLRYGITDKLWCNLSLKSHYAIASFVEWGLGYNLWKSNTP